MNDKGAAAKKYDFEVTGNSKDLGELQFNVLRAVAERRYDEASDLILGYQKMKGSHPAYLKRTGQLFKHAVELIKAIEAKKTFPNLTGLNQGKQEELHQKAMENWEGLRVTLRRLRSTERDILLEDARSSVWVIKAVLLSFLIILGIFIVNEGFKSFGTSFSQFLDESTKLISSEFNSFLD